MSLYTKTHRAETGPNVVAVIDPNMGAYGRAIAHFNDRGADLETAQRHADAFIASQEMLQTLKAARESLDEITDLEAVCRSGGPDPMDLEGLWDNLSEAVLIASRLDDLIAETLSKAGGCNQVDDTAAIDQLSGEAS